MTLHELWFELVNDGQLGGLVYMALVFLLFGLTLLIYEGLSRLGGKSQ